MKRLLILLLSVPLIVPAQNKPLVIEGSGPIFYISHKVAPKENYYSIGRIYNTSPKELAPFNNLSLENGLTLGQVVKIPLLSANFSQSGLAAQDEVLIPVYHTVAGREGLYRISANYNKLPVEFLKQWNNLKADVVNNGTNLIVGYLKVKKDQSPLASMATTRPMPAQQPVNPDKSGKKVGAANTTPTPGLPTVAEAIPPANLPAASNPEPAIDKKKSKKEPIIKDVVVKDVSPGKKITVPASRGNFNDGVFKPDYEKQTSDKGIRDETGQGGMFKSTSGWEDGKYYCLHNSSSPGTIVKVTNTATGKSIYAKVLDTIPDIQQNSGLLIRISNAAAEALGAADKFYCRLSYTK